MPRRARRRAARSRPAPPRRLGGLGDRGQVDQPGAVAVLVAVAAAGLDREPGLAGAARPEHGDQAPAGEQRVDPGEVVVAPDEAGQGGGQVARGHLAPHLGSGQPARSRRRWRSRRAAPGSAPSRSARVSRDPLVHGEGLGLAALGGERVHQQRGRPLVHRVLGEQGGQPGRGVVGAAQRQLRLGQVRARPRPRCGPAGSRPPGRPRRSPTVRRTAPPPHPAARPPPGDRRPAAGHGRARPAARTAARPRRRSVTPSR